MAERYSSSVSCLDCGICETVKFKDSSGVNWYTEVISKLEKFQYIQINDQSFEFKCDICHKKASVVAQSE